MHPRTLLLTIIFLIGFAALVYEIYSVQVLFMFFVNNTHAVAIAISSFLAGLAISSLVFSWRVRDTTHNLRIVFWMQLAAALYGALVLRRVDVIPALLDIIHTHVADTTLEEALKLSIMWLFLFMPAFFIGGALPLINGLYLSTREAGTRETGIVYFWDMLGAILGALLTGFVFLPQLGISVTILIPIILNLLVCALCITSRRGMVLMAVAVFLALGMWHTRPYPPSPIRHDLDGMFGRVLFQQESPFGRITVGEMPSSERQLFINYRIMCQSSSGGLSEGQLGDILSRAAPQGGRALNIGLGCGMTAANMAFGGVFTHLDIVEINPVVKHASETYFRKDNRDVVHAPNVNVIIENGAEYIRQTDVVYDAIAIDIEEVNIIYSSPLYTKEYFEILKQHLKPGGVLGVWSVDANNNFSKVMYNTIAAVFDHVTVFPSYGGAIIFFASDEPMLTLPGPPDARHVLRRQVILTTPNTEVNTLDYKRLEKYYNMSSEFGLPDDYTEPYATEYHAPQRETDTHE